MSKRIATGESFSALKVVGQLVCGPGEAGRSLTKTLDEFERLCDDVIVCFCNATEDEKALVRSYDFRGYDDDREWGRFQPDIKTDLLRRIHKLGADWILALDADETVPSLDRAEIEKITVGRESAFLYVVNLWNDEQHYSKTLSFWNVRLYQADASKGVQFLRKPVHCGNAPPYFYNQSAKRSYVPHILLHRGLMKREDRLRKAERYALYDPRAIHKGREYYDALTADWSGSVYEQTAVLSKLQHYVSTL